MPVWQHTGRMLLQEHAGCLSTNQLLSLERKPWKECDAGTRGEEYPAFCVTGQGSIPVADDYLDTLGEVKGRLDSIRPHQEQNVCYLAVSSMLATEALKPVGHAKPPGCLRCPGGFFCFFKALVLPIPAPSGSLKSGVLHAASWGILSVPLAPAAAHAP
jgi:hypothetical protein